MNTIKDLWKHKNNLQGKINITLFFINIFLLFCHVFLMAMYISFKQYFMIGINFISILLYSCSIFFCFKKPIYYIPISFIEIWIHMICGIIVFGWRPCFQNWTFALVNAYFLPAFSVDYKRKKQPFFFALILTATYFVMAILTNVVNLEIIHPLSDLNNKILFVFNNLCAFVSVVMFSVFYTSKSSRKEEELLRKADYDELTSLYNRYAINKISRDIMQDCKSKKCLYNVAILDIDYFKKVNDVYGHNAGDSVLKLFADILKSFSSKDILVGRWGGEEFVILTTSNIKYQDFLVLLEKIRLKVGNYKFKISDKISIKITVSIGSACIKANKDLEISIKKADDNLYKAKNTGRNKIVG